MEKWYGPERIVRVDGTGAVPDVTKRISAGIDSVNFEPGFEGALRVDSEHPNVDQTMDCSASCKSAYIRFIVVKVD